MISVVTITYNNFEELVATLDSIKDIDGIESVVINGGDCQKTYEYLNDLQGIIIQERDKGIADAFNKGVRHANGDAIVFLNSGDKLVDKSYYSEVQKIFDEDEQVDFVFSNILFVDKLLGKVEFCYRKRCLGSGMPYYHQSMVVRKLVFDKIGPFSHDYKISMDYDFIVRMYKARCKGHYIDSISVEMDGAGISATNESISIAECYHSLKSNRMLSVANALGLVKRFSLFKTRQLIKTVGGDKLLRFTKMFKNRIF